MDARSLSYYSRTSARQIMKKKKIFREQHYQHAPLRGLDDACTDITIAHYYHHSANLLSSY